MPRKVNLTKHAQWRRTRRSGSCPLSKTFYAKSVGGPRTMKGDSRGDHDGLSLRADTRFEDRSLSEICQRLVADSLARGQDGPDTPDYRELRVGTGVSGHAKDGNGRSMRRDESGGKTARRQHQNRQVSHRIDRAEGHCMLRRGRPCPILMTRIS